ncbi:hypothetical protein [Chryseobacterium sp. ERMR1:04]|uniref:hypothetical protein n=1 Tax=Chryseobacterium sp. ERMR1:04 TaxID=1705393 RepID=UPI0006C88761|nr:hypothetical protein [Chryseobacterium sp. ERMR1:04]KPH15148.1 hypothetical protein AMQ68_07065 [Chryseobacterium sp. ERMR1:04]
MSIITDYKIVFGVRKIHNMNYKLISSINPSLDAILFEFSSVTSCDSLIRTTGLVLDSSPQLEDVLIFTQGLQVIKIGYSETKLYHDENKYDANPNITAAYTLPTADFKEIVKVWRNFVKGDDANGGLLT